jgi:hypothetical protein
VTWIRRQPETSRGWAGPAGRRARPGWRMQKMGAAYQALRLCEQGIGRGASCGNLPLRRPKTGGQWRNPGSAARRPANAGPQTLVRKTGQFRDGAGRGARRFASPRKRPDGRLRVPVTGMPTRNGGNTTLIFKGLSACKPVQVLVFAADMSKRLHRELALFVRPNCLRKWP